MKHHYLPTRNGFSSPAKGTRARQIILLALRPQGLSVAEAIQRKLIHDPNQLLTLLMRLECDSGFDIRRFGHRRTKDMTALIYRVVGRHRWNGTYRPFMSVSSECPNVRQ